jgi:hypothetical protein
MTPRLNKGPSPEDTGPSRQWRFSVFLYENLQPISLTVTVHSSRIEIYYDFRLYRHVIKMNLDGYAEEKVWRSGKLLHRESVATQPNFANQNSDYSKLPYLKSYFVAGAGNGFLGMGITKEERFTDVYIKVMVYERMFCFQVVQQRIDLNILTVAIEPSSFEIDVAGSDMGQLSEVLDYQVEKASPRELVVAATSGIRPTPKNDIDEAIEVPMLKGWYESEFGIGQKTSDLYLMNYEIRRQSTPEAGYQVLYSHPRKEGQQVPRFIPSAEIDKPQILGNQVTSLCPTCNTRCAAQLEQVSYFGCRECKSTWWQKR